MEKQLAEYRARKAKEAAEQKKSFLSSLFAPKSDSVSSSKNSSPTSRNPATNQANVTEQSNSIILYRYPRLRTCLKISLWLCLWGFFVQVGFGSVFFVASLFCFLYASMTSGTRKAWEPSAYSVFNENCEAIEGTLSGEQFDKELKFGAGSIGK